MIQHYLKIAYRNLLKYRTQSIISIIGLAIGLACFALSTFWVQYDNRIIIGFMTTIFYIEYILIIPIIRP